jgi:hypothetical protein
MIVGTAELDLSGDAEHDRAVRQTGKFARSLIL